MIVSQDNYNFWYSSIYKVCGPLYEVESLHGIVLDYIVKIVKLPLAKR